jgi:hypothetical protein
VPCGNRWGVFAGQDAADGLQVDGSAGGDGECRGKLEHERGTTYPDMARQPKRVFGAQFTSRMG